MSTMNMTPKNLAILAALGIAAYWFVSRRARAATTAGPVRYSRTATGGNTSNAPPKPNLLTGVIAGMDAYINGSSSQVTQMPASVDGDPTNSPSSYQVGAWNPDDINGLY